MLNKSGRHRHLFLGIILILGIFFRFVNLDGKVYWQDEAATSLRISGYSSLEFVEKVYNGQPITVGELRDRYQSPNASKNLGDTLKVLMGKAEHPPLYYLMARFWTQLFGGSVTAMRSLPAFISLLAFPAMYWLCQELFAAPLISWVAIALISVSPIHVLYAQEARQYSLWIVLILLSSAALLQAVRKKNIRSWAIYGLTLVLGCYTHLFFGLIFLGHGIYLLVAQGLLNNRLLALIFKPPLKRGVGGIDTQFALIFKPPFSRGVGGIDKQLCKNSNQIVIPYLLTSAAALCAFAPWIWVFIQYKNNSHYFDGITTALGREISVSRLLGKWFRSVNRFFHDADLGSANLILVLFAAYSLYFVCRHTPKRVWWFIFTLFGVTALTLGLPDLINGGQRSVRTRYLIPCGLALELSIAYLLTVKVSQATKIWQQRVWQGVVVILISIGVISNSVSFQADSWWNKNIALTKHYPKIARMINQANNPLVISDSSETNILSLSSLLKSEVQLQLFQEGNLPTIAQRAIAQTRFVFDPSDALLHSLQTEQNLPLDPVVDKRRVKLYKNRVSSRD